MQYILVKNTPFPIDNENQRDVAILAMLGENETTAHVYVDGVRSADMLHSAPIYEDLYQALVRTTVVANGEEETDYGTCLIALKQDRDGTLPKNIQVTWERDVDKCAIDNCPEVVYLAALEGHLLTYYGRVILTDEWMEKYANRSHQ